MHDKARRLLRHPLPIAMGAVNFLILIGSARQCHQLQALMVKQHAILTPATTSPAPQAMNQDRIAKLFGIHAAKSASSPQATNLPLKLLDSFVNVTSESSAALIQVDGELARRVIFGQDVVSGVRLAALATDHMLLERNGISEHLNSSRASEFTKAYSTENSGASYIQLQKSHPSKLVGLSSMHARGRTLENEGAFGNVVYKLATYAT